MSEYTCPTCGEEVGMMGHSAKERCPGQLSPKATELGRLRVELRQAQAGKGYTHDFPGTVLERALAALREHDEEYHYTTPASLLEDLEAAIKNPPLPCPFCLGGHWLQTGTKGRLQCSGCGSQALDGRKAEAVPIDRDAAAEGES